MKKNQDNTTPYVTHNGSIIWVNAKGHWHRINGPSVEYANGSKEWRIEGECYTEQEWRKKVKQIKKDEGKRI